MSPFEQRPTPDPDDPPDAEGPSRGEGPPAAGSTEDGSGRPERAGNGGSEAENTGECPNCGRTIREDEANYCPGCGTALGERLTAGDIARSFFQEFADIERGFSRSLLALTLRPGEALSGYLDGARGRLMNPGRYLLACVVIGFLSYRALTWTGALQSFTRLSTSLFGDFEGEAAFAQAVRQLYQVFYQSQWIAMVFTLVLAMAVALWLRRLFSGQLQTFGQSLAFGSFLVGHASLLESGLYIGYAVPVRLATGRPAPALGVLEGVVLLGYAAWIAHRTFRPGWRSAAKGLLGTLWAYLEVAGGLGLVGSAYLGWVAVQSGALSPAKGAGITAALMAAYSLPILAHAGVASYDRLR
jgi:hypothetical protein